MEDIFDFLADIRNETAWNPRAVRIEKTSAGPIGAGATFRGLYQGLGVLETQLVEFERPTRISFRGKGSRMSVAGTFVLTPIAGGTMVTLTADLEPRGPFRIAAPLMAQLIRRQNTTAAERLQRALQDGGERH
jgi:polyketide cyclase/dehydrase/lipid transport protein